MGSGGGAGQVMGSGGRGRGAGFRGSGGGTLGVDRRGGNEGVLEIFCFLLPIIEILYLVSVTFGLASTLSPLTPSLPFPPALPQACPPLLRSLWSLVEPS